MNAGNGFIMYRIYFTNYLKTRKLIIPMQLLSPFAALLWNSEPENVKGYYKELSGQLKKLHVASETTRL